MPQTVIIDSNNVVRVVDSGPVGPPGFGGSAASGPADLIPLPISRQAPWSGWIQFQGLPCSTIGVAGFRVALMWASAPAMSVAMESIGASPIVMSNGQPISILGRVSGINVNGAPIEGLEPLFETATWRLSCMCSDGVSEPTTEIIGEWPLNILPTATIPSEARVFEFYESNTARGSIALPEGGMILGFTIEAFKSEGVPFTEEDNVTLAINQVSAWYGAPLAEPVIDPTSMHTYQGMQSNVALATRWQMPFATEDTTTIVPGGLMFDKIVMGEGGLSSGGNAQLTAEQDTDEPVMALKTDRLRVMQAPTAGTDVVRLVDLPDGPASEYSYDAHVISASAQLNAQTAPVVHVDMGATDIEVAFNNVTRNYPVTMIVTGGSVTRSLTTSSPTVDYLETISPGEVYLITVLAWPMSPAADPDIANIEYHIRKIQSAPLGRQLPHVMAQAVIDATDTDMIIDSATVEIEPDGQTLTVPNPGVGNSALVYCTFHQTSGSNKTVDFDCGANHYPLSSAGSGIPSGSTYRAWATITGGASAPSVDFGPFEVV